MVNKILILVIIIFVINHLTNGQILNTIKGFFTSCTTEKFIGATYTNKKGVYSNVPQVPYDSQRDFAYINQNDIDELDDETYRLYRFINNMVTPNINIYELTSSRGKKMKASNELVKEIIIHLERIFNCSGYKFSNIKLIDQIVYYENPRGKELESFNFSSDVSFHNKSIGSVVINIESFLREDKFYQNHMKSGFLTITNIRLANRIHPNGINKEKKIVSGYKLDYSMSPRNQSRIKKPINPGKNQIQAVEKNNKNINKMNESFGNHFVPRENFDELFIRPQSNSEAFMNDTDNSLIPTIDEISSEEYS
jgi:hypothetical protein